MKAHYHDYSQPRPIHQTSTPVLLCQLNALHTELIDLAYELDLRGSQAAADVAMTTSVRLKELCAECSASQIRTISTQIPLPCPKRTSEEIRSFSRAELARIMSANCYQIFEDLCFHGRWGYYHYRLDDVMF